MFLRIWMGRGFVLSYLKCVYVAGWLVLFFSSCFSSIFDLYKMGYVSPHQASKTPTHSCRNSPRKRQISVPHQAVIRLCLLITSVTLHGKRISWQFFIKMESPRNFGGI